MRALLAQLTPEPGAPGPNAARAAEAIRAHPEADLAVFPELFLSGYRLRGLGAVATTADGPELKTIADACAATGTAALVGHVEPTPAGPCNTLTCIDETGTVVGGYRKVQLFGEEAEAFVPGEWLLVVELAGRRVAPLICFDVEFPELARSAAMAGAELLVTAAANMEPFGREHEIHTAARALENRLPHLYVNRGGAEGGVSFVGGTRAIDSAGVVVAETASRGDELLVVEVPATGTDDPRVDYLAFEPSRIAVEVQTKSHSQGGWI